MGLWDFKLRFSFFGVAENRLSLCVLGFALFALSGFGVCICVLHLHDEVLSLSLFLLF